MASGDREESQKRRNDVGGGAAGQAAGNGLAPGKQTRSAQVLGASAAPTGAEAAPRTGTATLKVEVNVRSQPSRHGAILEAGKKGATFQVTGDAGGWYRIEHGGGPAYITTLPQYVEFTATPAPAAPAPAQAPAQEDGLFDEHARSGGWLEQARSAAAHLIETVKSFFDGDEAEALQSEGKPEPAGKPPAERGTEQAASGKGGQAGPGERSGGPTDEPAVPGGSLLFKQAFEIVDANAKLRDAKLAATGKTIARGTKVFVAKAEKTFVQIVTGAEAEPAISEADDVWTAFSNLGGTGADVALGNEATDESDKTKADELRAGLPPGRQAGKSAFKWQFGGGFQPSLEGRALESSLMGKVQALMQWAIENDMVTGDIVIGDGVRGPKTAHRMCVAWNIQFRYGSVIKLADLQALPDGKDADGTKWYDKEWTEEQIKDNARSIRASEAIAAAGYDSGDAKRAPLPISGRPGVSRHCTGRAVDVTIPWRAPGKDASTGATDVWAWEDIYKQFGLHRPLHKTLVSDAKLQENWHIEETSKKLADGEDGEG